MKKLTMSRARQLIERELGIKAKELTAPPDMNGNPNYPWYMMTSGTMLIEVHTEDFHQGKSTDKMVALCVTHENSSKGTTEYFYGDTLEYAAPYTDWNNREAFCEGMEDPQSDAMLCRLKREAMDSCWGHFHQKAPVQIGFKAGTLLIVKNNHAVFDRYDGFFKANPDYKELAQHFICNEIPAQDSRLRFIGNGKLAYNNNPVYVLQNPVTEQVFLYDAKCKDGLKVSQDTNDLKGRLEEANREIAEKTDNEIGKHRSDLML